MREGVLYLFYECYFHFLRGVWVFRPAGKLINLAVGRQAFCCNDQHKKKAFEEVDKGLNEFIGINQHLLGILAHHVIKPLLL